MFGFPNSYGKKIIANFIIGDIKHLADIVNILCSKGISTIKLRTYGAFVLIDNKYNGLIHISEISDSYVKNVSCESGEEDTSLILKSESDTIVFPVAASAILPTEDTTLNPCAGRQHNA